MGVSQVRAPRRTWPRTAISPLTRGVEVVRDISAVVEFVRKRRNLDRAD
jgi:hypothetical protein